MASSTHAHPKMYLLKRGTSRWKYQMWHCTNIKFKGGGELFSYFQKIYLTGTFIFLAGSTSAALLPPPHPPSNK